MTVDNHRQYTTAVNEWINLNVRAAKDSKG